MREQKVNISPGRPITVPTPDEMSQRGAVDGAAARQAGLYESPDGAVLRVEAAEIPALVDAYRWQVTQAAAMTTSRHDPAIATANAGVAARTNELAAAAAALADAEDKLATAGQAKTGFDERVVEQADPALALPPPVPPATGTVQSSGDDDAVSGADEGAVSEDTQAIDPVPTMKEAAPPSRAWRFPLRRDLHPSVVVLVLVLIAGAEFALNARAFQSVREVEWLVLLLAGLVGLGMVALCHRVGSNAGDLLEVPVGAAGRSPAKLVEVAVEVPALLGGIAGVASIRASYFSLVGIRIPTFGLVCIQIALAVAAIGTTMAGRNQAADESRDRGRNLEQAEHGRRQPHKTFVTAQNRLVDAEAGLRAVLQALVNDYHIQVPEVALGVAAYIRAYATAAGIKVTGTLADPATPQLVAQADQWLAAHPVGTHAHLTLPHTSAAPAVTNASVTGKPAAPVTSIHHHDDQEEAA